MTSQSIGLTRRGAFVTPLVFMLMSCAAVDDAPRQSAQRLSVDQCSYFQVGGTITICHRTGSTRNPYSIIRVAQSACINAHAGHTGDRVAVDGSCGPDACLAVGAPVDSTLPCCQGLTDVSGICTDLHANDLVSEYQQYQDATVEEEGEFDEGEGE